MLHQIEMNCIMRARILSLRSHAMIDIVIPKCSESQE